MIHINKGRWPRSLEPTCSIDLNDSLSLFHIDITGRLTYTYLPDSLSLIVQVTAPLGGSFCDTVSFSLTPLRKYLWDDFRFPYCSHVRFLETGRWQFSFRQRMGVETLKGVTAIGVYITKEKTAP